VTVVEETHARAADRAQPRQLIVTLFGLYAREHGGWLSVAALVRLLAALDIDEPAVRSSVSRLKRRGLLEPRRVGGAAGYALSGDAIDLYADGDVRIFGRRRATAADGWVLVAFSVPEAERDRRHALRARLGALGFGTVAPGVWVAPGHLADEVAEVLRRAGLDGYVQLFRGEHLAFGDLRGKVATWWDLDTLHAMHTEFLHRHGPLRQRWSGAAPTDPATAFADHVRVLTDWRRLAYADPGLPLELLPPDRAEARAAELFAELQERLAVPAREHAEAVIAGE
jgi:phenylacetic acid degradation operon negative regulatory protein